MNAIKISEEFGWRVREYIPDSRIYLFGSQAKGTARPNSDIDVAILIEKRPEKELYWEMERAIGLLEAEYMEPIEGHLVTMEDRTGFVRTILHTGIEVANPDLL